MTRAHLLDSNAFIALALADHEHHQQASGWVAGVDRIAVCPIVEGALVRFLVRLGQSAAAAQGLLAAWHADPRVEFWPDEVSYVHVDLTRVVGHRQVTDAYLAALAANRGARLATFDVGLAQVFPEHVVLIT